MSEDNLHENINSNKMENINDISSSEIESTSDDLIEKENIIETLTSDIELKERKPRGTKISLLVTFGLLFGPISLILSIFTDLFNFIPINSTYLFSGISIIFLVSSIISAKSIQ